MNKHRVRTFVLSAIAAGSLVMGSEGAGATTLKEVLDEGITANKIAQKSQEKVNKIVDQTETIIGKYQAVLKTIEGLRVYNAQLQRQIDRQLKEIEDLNVSIKGVTYVKRQITPLMLDMVDVLETFIDNDIPFQIETRLAGVKRLKDMMDDPTIDTSEKFRSVFEAYQIESDYGRALIAYDGTLNIQGADRKVDILQVGRIALLYQTPNGKISGAWNKETEQWEEVDEGTYRKSITTALRVAKKQAAADQLLKLPILAPELAK